MEEYLGDGVDMGLGGACMDWGIVIPRGLVVIETKSLTLSGGVSVPGIRCEASEKDEKYCKIFKLTQVMMYRVFIHRLV